MFRDYWSFLVCQQRVLIQESEHSGRMYASVIQHNMLWNSWGWGSKQEIKQVGQNSDITKSTRWLYWCSLFNSYISLIFSYKKVSEKWILLLRQGLSRHNRWGGRWMDGRIDRLTDRQIDIHPRQPRTHLYSPSWSQTSNLPALPSAGFTKIYHHTQF